MTEPLPPLIIDPRFLRPLPQSAWNATCSRCGEPRSRWELGMIGREVKPVCSLCFLYHSQWGEKRLDQIHALVEEMERETGERFFRAADGRSLLQCKDADHALGAIAWVSRHLQLKLEDAAEVAKKAAEEPEEEKP